MAEIDPRRYAKTDIYLTIKGERLDVTRIVRKNSLRFQQSLCTEEWKSAVATASFTLMGGREWREWTHPSEENGQTLFSRVVGGILDSKESRQRVHAEIYFQSELIFKGLVELNAISISSETMAGDLTLECRDYSQDLDKECRLNFSCKDWYANDIIHRILIDGGIIPSESVEDEEDLAKFDSKGFDPGPELQAKIPFFVVTDEDGNTFREIIDTLLFEMGGFVLVRDMKTDRYTVKLVEGSDEPVREVTYLVRHQLMSQGAYSAYDGVAISWPVAELSKNPMALYVEDTGNSLQEYPEGSGVKQLEGSIIPGGGFYPEGGNEEAEEQEYDEKLLDRDYQEGRRKKQNRDGKLLYVEEESEEIQINAVWRDDGKTAVELLQPKVNEIGKEEGPQFYPRKAWILFQNPDPDREVNLLGFSIWGKAAHVTAIKKTVVTYSGYEPKNPEEYEASYIFDGESAVKFGDFYMKWKDTATTVTQWTEHVISSPDFRESRIGETVVAKHKGVESGQLNIIISEALSFEKGVPFWTFASTAVSGYKEFSHYTDGRKPGATRYLLSQTSEFYQSWRQDELRGGEWSEEDTRVPGRYTWTRQRYTWSDGSITYSTEYCIHGEKGDPGKNVITEYRWGTSDKNPPTSYRLWRWSFNGKFMAVGGVKAGRSFGEGDIESQDWSNPPAPPVDERQRYLWARSSNDGGATWYYYIVRTINEPIMTLRHSPDVFRKDERNWVSSEETVEFWVEFHGRDPKDKDVRTWSLSPFSTEPGDGPQATLQTMDDSQMSDALSKTDHVKVIIPRGFLYDSFTVTYTNSNIADGDGRLVAVSSTIYGQRYGTGKPQKLPTLDIDYDYEYDKAEGRKDLDYEKTVEFQARFPSVLDSNSGKPLMDGDFMIGRKTNRKDPNKRVPVPYRFNAYEEQPYDDGRVLGEWHELRASDAPVENYAQIMDETLADVLAMDIDIEDVTIAYYAYFHDIASTRGFIDSLSSEDIYLAYDNEEMRPGMIHAGRWGDGGVDSGEGRGFYLDSNGIFKVNDGEFDGEFHAHRGDFTFFRTLSNAGNATTTYTATGGTSRWDIRSIIGSANFQNGQKITQKNDGFWGDVGDTVVSLPEDMNISLRSGQAGVEALENISIALIKRYAYENGDLITGDDSSTLTIPNVPNAMIALAVWMEAKTRGANHASTYNDKFVKVTSAKGTQELNVSHPAGGTKLYTFRHSGGDMIIKFNTFWRGTGWESLWWDNAWGAARIAVIPLLPIYTKSSTVRHTTFKGGVTSGDAYFYDFKKMTATTLYHNMWTSHELTTEKFKSTNQTRYYSASWLYAGPDGQYPIISQSGGISGLTTFSKDSSQVSLIGGSYKQTIRRGNETGDIASGGWCTISRGTFTVQNGKGQGAEVSILYPASNKNSQSSVGTISDKFDSGYFKNLYADSLMIVEGTKQKAVKAYIVNSCYNGASFWRLWSDGWAEQGDVGRQAIPTDTIGAPVSFQIPFKNTSYFIVISSYETYMDTHDYAVLSAGVRNKASFTPYNNSYSIESGKWGWYAAGMVNLDEVL